MINIALVNNNCLFRQSLKQLLEKEGNFRVQSETDDLDQLFNKLPAIKTDLLILDIDIEKANLEKLKNINQQIPEIRCIVMGFELSMDSYNELIQYDVKGYISKKADLSEFLLILNEVYNGKVHFPQEILQELLVLKKQQLQKTDLDFSAREREILQLLCNGLNNDKIAIKLHLSQDTIKWHRSNILLKSGCTNILSLYKYALKHKLVNP